MSYSLLKVFLKKVPNEDISHSLCFCLVIVACSIYQIFVYLSYHQDSNNYRRATVFATLENAYKQNEAIEIILIGANFSVSIFLFKTSHHAGEFNNLAHSISNKRIKSTNLNFFIIITVCIHAILLIVCLE